MAKAILKQLMLFSLLCLLGSTIRPMEERRINYAGQSIAFKRALKMLDGCDKGLSRLLPVAAGGVALWKLENCYHIYAKYCSSFDTCYQPFGLELAKTAGIIAIMGVYGYKWYASNSPKASIVPITTQALQEIAQADSKRVEELPANAKNVLLVWRKQMAKADRILGMCKPEALLFRMLARPIPDDQSATFGIIGQRFPPDIARIICIYSYANAVREKNDLKKNSKILLSETELDSLFFDAPASEHSAQTNGVQVRKRAIVLNGKELENDAVERFMDLNQNYLIRRA